MSPRQICHTHVSICHLGERCQQITLQHSDRTQYRSVSCKCSLMLRVSRDKNVSNLVVDGLQGGGNQPAGTMVVLTADPSHPKPTDRQTGMSVINYNSRFFSLKNPDRLQIFHNFLRRLVFSILAIVFRISFLNINLRQQANLLRRFTQFKVSISEFILQKLSFRISIMTHRARAGCYVNRP